MAEQKVIRELTPKQREAIEKISATAVELGISETKLCERIGITGSALSQIRKQDTDDLNAKLTAQQADFAAEKLFGGYKFASERVKSSVLAEFKSKGFKLENGEFVGGKEYLEGLKQSEPSVFAAEQKPGLFMGSTQNNVSADANNLESQIYTGFGLKK